VRARENRQQLIVIDEMAKGAAHHMVQADFEATFLEALAATGVLSVTATHNMDTTKLADPPGSPFMNMHVAKYSLVPGPNESLPALYAGAATAMEKAGVPAQFVESFRRRGQARLEKIATGKGQ